MLIQALFRNAKTDEEYRDSLKKKQAVMGLVIVLGAGALAAGLLVDRLVEESHRASFLSGVYTGAGTALIVAAVVMIIRMQKVKKDEKLLRRERIKAGDEREMEIVKKAGATAGFVVSYLGFAGMLVLGFFSMAAFWTLWCTVIAYFVIWMILIVYYKRKL